MLSQIASFLVSPITLAVGVIYLGLLFRRRWPSVIAIFVLLISGVPSIADLTLSAWQNEYVHRRTLDTPAEFKADAILVLGGAASYSRSRGGVIPEWGDAVDRLFAGVDLFKAGAAPLLWVSGGSNELPPSQPSEGEMMYRRAVDMGIPASAIKVLPRALDTEAEADTLRRSADTSKPRLLLVTSAFHMRRAVLIFEAAGFEVYPVAVDIKIPAERSYPRDWIPRASAVMLTELVIREFCATAYYELKYFIRREF